MVRSSDDNEKKNVVKKLKDVEISLPIVYGNIAFWLGKKASEYQSHKWTVYVRSATNEDLSVTSMLPPEAFVVLRKSFDARKSQNELKFVYTVEMGVDKLLNLEPRTYDFISKLEPKFGVIEHVPYERVVGDLVNVINDTKKIDQDRVVMGENGHSGSYKLLIAKGTKITVVGSISHFVVLLIVAAYNLDDHERRKGYCCLWNGESVWQWR